MYNIYCYPSKRDIAIIYIKLFRFGLGMSINPLQINNFFIDSGNFLFISTIPPPDSDKGTIKQ